MKNDMFDTGQWDSWSALPRLRWAKRRQIVSTMDAIEEVTVLQQQWRNVETGEIKWEDVPVKEEE